MLLIRRVFSAIRPGRFVLTLVLLALTMICLTSCPGRDNENGKKVFVLAFDGMDPVLLTEYMARGLLPNFRKLAAEGCFYSMQTSVPPQSPVAWSNFITGQNPGGHGIFDFIHRVPETMEPYLSTSMSDAPPEEVSLGLLSVRNEFKIPFTGYKLPFKGGDIRLMRKGRAFWEYLDEAGIETTIMKLPSNFPPVTAGTRSLSGMGTPDILGSYGNFTYYTNVPLSEKQEISGGAVVLINREDNVVKTSITGPPNTFAEGTPALTIPLDIYIDPEGRNGKIVLPDREIMLNEGEWSDWVQLDFKPIPYLQGLNGICRFFLKEVNPDFKLYMSPINIDPSNPALPISHPDDYARELQTQIGFFYTQGMAEDTKALSNGVLSNAEYLQQAGFVFEERMKLFRYEFERFLRMKRGLFFFYFSSLDQSSHVFWRTMDHASPAYDQKRDGNFHHVMQELYEKMDHVLGEALAGLQDNTTLIVMSDHGFAPFYRGFQLNSWLLENGYITLKDPTRQEDGELFAQVDWAHTKAYALGLNGLYVNLKGREPNGIVDNGWERDKLLDELMYKMTEVTDPTNGSRVILDVYRTDREYTGPHRNDAPDLIVGYNRGYRSGWESALGAFPRQLLKDNTNAWSGDHCVSPRIVPAIFLSNKKSISETPSLTDLAPTILAEFGLTVPNDMVGKPLFK